MLKAAAPRRGHACAMQPERLTYRFDRFELDLRRGCLSTEGAEVDLGPKAFQVLRHLVEHAGRLLSREELIQVAWPNVVVTDEGVAEMRRIMRLDPHYLRWIGNAHYLLGDDASALQSLRVAGSRQPRHRPTHVWLAAAAARAGETEEARRAAQTVLQLQPDFTTSRFTRLRRLSRPVDSERLSRGLRLAGLPE